jgi:hypothetical protein
MNYKNGNVLVSISEDGTKVRTWEGIQCLEFPESLDVKITNQCDLECPYCHESSVKNGDTGNLDLLFEKLSVLPSGVELAIGGGNPLSHSELPGFLRKCLSHGFICNITVNHRHLLEDDYFYLVRDMIRRDLIHGIGISYNRNSSVDNINYLQKYTDNIVIHTICGVDTVDEVLSLKDKLSYLKLLVLGYKTVGRGAKYMSPKVDSCIKSWYKNINSIINSCEIISFDNLSIDQLNLRRLMSDSKWNSIYQGDDFTLSMYVDAVKGEFAPTSRSNADKRVDWNSMSLTEYFILNHE